MAQDPDWKAFAAGQPKGCLITQESRILTPTSFSPLQ
jgi:hypothetical protein